MKKLIIFFILLALNTTAFANWDTKENFVYSSIDGGNVLADAEAEDATFAVDLGTNSATFPSCTDSNPCRLVIFGSTCSQPSSCGIREIVLIKTASCVSSDCTLTVKSRNQESTTHSGDWGSGSKVQMNPTVATLAYLPIPAPSTLGNIMKSDGTNWTSSSSLSITSITDDVIWKDNANTYGGIFEMSNIATSQKTFTFPNRNLTIDNITTATTTTGTGYVKGDGSAISFDTSIGPTELASTDFGNFTCNGTSCTIDNASVTPAMLPQTGLTDEYCLTYEGTGGTMEWQTCGTGFTNLTDFDTQTAWRVFYSDGSGDTTELALGADGTYLKSNGASSAPSFDTPAGSGTIESGVDNTLVYYNGAGTTVNDSVITIDETTGQLTIPKQSGIAGQLLLYEANSTDTNGMGWKGPTSRTTDVYLQLPDADPSGSNSSKTSQILTFEAPSSSTSASAWLTTDGSGACAADAVCLGGHTHSESMTIVDSGTLTFDEASADPNDADVILSGADGVFKIATSNGVNNEDLTIDLDATANTATIGSTTGVTMISTGSIALSGAINVVVTTDGSESPTASQMYGTMFVADHYTATSDTLYTLPAAVAGMSACFYDNGGGAGGITIEIDGSDVIILNGTALDAGDTIDSPGVAGDGANGDFICLMAIDATNWITLGRSGTWVDGGAS